MREEFEYFGVKKWIVTDDALIYGNKEFKYDICSNIRIVTSASLMLAGVAQMNVQDKLISISFKLKDSERAIQAIAYANEKIDNAKGISKEYKFVLRAHTGSVLEVYEDYISLSHMQTGNTFGNILQGGASGGKRIRMSDIIAIQFKEPAGAAVGFIQFTFPGSGENKGNVFSSINDENSIPVSPLNLELAKDIVNYIESKRKELRNSPNFVVPTPTMSTADELKKFKDLLDMGIITQEEFDAKKKQLLGL